MKYLRNYGKLKGVKREEDGDEPKPKKPRTEYKQFPQLFHEVTIPPGEDEASNTRNQKALLLEEKKCRPNKNTVSILMDRTFAFRRQDIMKLVKPVKELLAIFPSVKHFEQVFLFCIILLGICRWLFAIDCS